MKDCNKNCSSCSECDEAPCELTPSVLKLCPFCGGKAGIEYDGNPAWKPTFYDPDSGGNPVYWVCCEKCNATTDYKESKSEAVEAWNIREN